MYKRVWWEYLNRAVVFGLDKSDNWCSGLNTVTNFPIMNKIFLRGAISFPRWANRTKTRCISKCVSLQLCSLLRHISFYSLYKWPVFNFLSLNITRSLIDFLFYTCCLTPTQMDGSLPVPRSAVGSRYHHAACCVEHRLAVAIITVGIHYKTTEGWERLLNKFVQKIKRCCFSSTRRCSWLRHCTINQKVAGSFPDGVTGFLYWYNPSGRNMVLRPTRPLTEMSTRYIA